MTLVVTHTKVSGIADDPGASSAGEVLPSDWNANHALAGLVSAAQLNANVVQATVNDTNVTGSIATQTLTLGWTGTLAAGRLNSNVVQGITSDTNVTGSISAQNLTLGWSGTLAAGRLNSNVVQGITNDTNITGSISAQNLTFAWSGQLGVTRGGSGLGTATLGDLRYGSGSNTIAALAGNTTSAKNFLTQTGTGSVSAAPVWSTIAAADVPSSALTASNDTNVTLTLGGTPASSLLAATSLTMGWSGTLAVARGGTGGGAASGTLLDNISGFSSTGFLTRTGSGTYAFQSTTNGITNANLAQAAAWTLKGNATSSTANEADFTIDSLTAKAVPTTSDEVLIWDAAASAMKKATIGNLPSSSGVSSLGGQTGALTVTGPLAMSGSALTLGGTTTAHGVALWEGTSAMGNSGAGTTGQALVSNGASADPSFQSGGWVLLNTLTASSSASLSDTTHLTSTYNEYELVFSNILAATAGGQTLELQVHSGGSFQATSYLGTTLTVGNGATTVVNTTTLLQLTTSGAVLTTGAGVTGSIRVGNPSGTSAPKNWYQGCFVSTGGTVANATYVSGFWNANGAVDGFQVLFGTGNIASGTVKIYGRL